MSGALKINEASHDAEQYFQAAQKKIFDLLVKKIKMLFNNKKSVMCSTMNRRRWLKVGSMLASGFPFFSGTLTSLAASASPETPDLPIVSGSNFKNVVPKLKARLFNNDNPFGPSLKAKQAITEAISSSYQYAMCDMEAKYKRIIADELKDKIMVYEGLERDMISITPGSSSVLQTAAIYFGKEGNSVITADPSYSDLPTRIPNNFKAHVVKVPLNAEYSIDLDAMEKAIDSTTKLIYICNPNNPTATIADLAKLKDFCERVSKKVAVLIDEAYIDYLPDPQATTLIESVKRGQNIIVARTFSKLHGLARIGYMVAQPDMLKKIVPFCTGASGISHAAIQAAIVSYQDKEFVQEALERNTASKEFLYKTLKGEGYEYIPSFANFVMFPLKMEGGRFADEMIKRGVVIRFWKFNNKDWCRVSIGRIDEMEAFAAAFKELS